MIYLCQSLPVLLEVSCSMPSSVSRMIFYFFHGMDSSIMPLQLLQDDSSPFLQQLHKLAFLPVCCILKSSHLNRAGSIYTRADITSAPFFVFRLFPSSSELLPAYLWGFLIWRFGHLRDIFFSSSSSLSLSCSISFCSSRSSLRVKSSSLGCWQVLSSGILFICDVCRKISFSPRVIIADLPLHSFTLHGVGWDCGAKWRGEGAADGTEHPLRCYRCKELGHVAQDCSGETSPGTRCCRNPCPPRSINAALPVVSVYALRVNDVRRSLTLDVPDRSLVRIDRDMEQSTNRDSDD
ncbi:unnamed protein product [Acanthosepion pharaonis]|uniref:CCHC-type domain-containing protein n=1 Tax=Acanthosepion pharaonis TaxID=158019 RepID=A0A812BM96_ACAPH|nr:unnamed protein product [Sepia pharaonis]